MSTLEQVNDFEVPSFIEEKKKIIHKKKITNNMIELGYHEDIKIDKDIRSLLKQEMKEMD